MYCEIDAGHEIVCKGKLHNYKGNGNGNIYLLHLHILILQFLRRDSYF